jgi:hypothetical protein
VTAEEATVGGPRSRPGVPGAYWRESLAQALELGDSRWSFRELMDAVSGCPVGLVDVAGWLCDEMSMGRVRIATDVELSPLVSRYERSPAARTYSDRLTR